MSKKALGKSYRKGLTFLQIADMFSTNEAARVWLERQRWGNNPRCPKCGSFDVQPDVKHPSQTHRCRDCRKQKRSGYFSVRTGTVMERTKMDHRTWAIGLYLYLTNIKGISSMRLHRELGITQKSAWFMLHRLRNGLGSEVVSAVALELPGATESLAPVLRRKRASLYHEDCFEWLKRRKANTIHTVITDPPYGLVEYSQTEQHKLRQRKGGVWRMPPAFDGYMRSPLPRFTTLNVCELEAIQDFFLRFGTSAFRVMVPGAHMFVATNPLLSHIVASSLADSGLESRGMICRLVMTLRGGDRPKNAHEEFSGVSVMPRSMAEPWLLLRKPLEGRVQDNLRKWGTGGLRRKSEDQPFGDVIESHPTRAAEKKLAPHPSLKPQAFLRQLVRAGLPLGKGVILDPFAGSGSMLAAANHVGYRSIGVEHSSEYIRMAMSVLPSLEAIKCPDTPSSFGASECHSCGA